MNRLIWDRVETQPGLQSSYREKRSLMAKYYGLFGSVRAQNVTVCLDALMPIGYNPLLPQQFTMQRQVNYWSDLGGYEMVIAPDPDFCSPIKSVQNFVRCGRVTYRSNDGFYKWVERDLRRALSTDPTV